MLKFKLRGKKRKKNDLNIFITSSVIILNNFHKKFSLLEMETGFE